MTTATSALTEPELHGLVDGMLDPTRRADVLRRLASSPQDRVLIEDWQEQGDLIRAAFRDVEQETLPVALDLSPPRLRCVDDSFERSIEPILKPADNWKTDRRKSGVAAATTLLVVAAGLVGTWLMVAQVGRDDDDAGPTSQTSTSHGTALDATLIDRAVAAVDSRNSGREEGDDGMSGGGLPAIRIPDLTRAGFVLTGVSTQGASLASLTLRYRDAGTGRLVVTVARLPSGATPAAPTAVEQGIAWHRADAAYAIAGTLPIGRLAAIAASLQNDRGN